MILNKAVTESAALIFPVCSTVLGMWLVLQTH